MTVSVGRCRAIIFFVVWFAFLDRMERAICNLYAKPFCTWHILQTHIYLNIFSSVSLTMAISDMSFYIVVVLPSSSSTWYVYLL